ncbi:MAG: UDP-N-acetylmuramate dehydrogenase [Chitinophagales bacterium]
MTIEHNAPLQSLNTFGVAATTKYFTRITELSDLQNLFNNPIYPKTPKLILGGGSNVLFTQNFEGILLYNAIKGIEMVKETEDHVWVKAYGGENWHEFVTYCVNQNWSGIENLSLIPGSVGAAPLQNIGAYGVELKDVFSELEAFDLKTGEIRRFTAEECQFDYRDSVFKRDLKDCYFVFSVTLKLHKTPQYKLDYGVIRQQLEAMEITELSIKAVSDAICMIRQEKLPNPKKIGNAGSFFKNPIVYLPFFEKLLNQYPSMPYYQIDAHSIKIPAGWLIEQCGWKGKKVGQTGSYKNQALVLVNYGNATGKEIAALAKNIKCSVKSKFNIDLEQEINMI